MPWSVFEQDVLYQGDRSGAEGADRKVRRPWQASGLLMAWLRLGLRQGRQSPLKFGVCVGGGGPPPRHQLHRQKVEGEGLCQGGALQEGLLQDMTFQQKFEG